ncbi:uncharacterized protein EV154DRAFT_486974 [Mucor mucedo]|uniref:uncharacterized protein n=1 Tax=Mucor mucedo TaxID=29922 RepID=UPI00221F807E|nr:uncharacterized protein EV154DRAFT_486974 [Mucor mucedo]KAI7874188.1 hypothetical protein EV154DRAFT_486974 [Mucor mucedo]
MKSNPSPLDNVPSSLGSSSASCMSKFISKPKIFYGNREDTMKPMTWLKSVEILHKGMAFSDEEIIFIVSSYLAGPAAIWWGVVEKDVLSWNSFVFEFTGQYDSVEQHDAWWEELENWKQSSNQGVDDFKFRLLELYEMLGVPIGSSARTRYFMRAIHRDIAQKVTDLGISSNNWAGVTATAKRVELIFLKYGRHKSSSFELPMSTERSRQNIQEDSESVKSFNSLSTTMRNVCQGMNDLQLSLDTVSNIVGSVNNLHHVRINNRPQNDNLVDNRTCYNCREVGQIATYSNQPTLPRSDSRDYAQCERNSADNQGKGVNTVGVSTVCLVELAEDNGVDVFAVKRSRNNGEGSVDSNVGVNNNNIPDVTNLENASTIAVSGSTSQIDEVNAPISLKDRIANGKSAQKDLKNGLSIRSDDTVYDCPYTRSNLDRSSPLSVLGTINDNPIKMIVDSGSSISVISKSFATKPGLICTGDRIHIRTIKTSKDRSKRNECEVTVSVPSRIGSKRTPEHMVIKEDSVTTAGEPLVLLGMTWLQQYDISIHAKEKLIEIPVNNRADSIMVQGQRFQQSSNVDNVEVFFVCWILMSLMKMTMM